MAHFNLEFLIGLIPDVIGCIGTIIILFAYGFLQIEKLKSESLAYSFLNFIGALMIFISLTFAWNLAAGLMEIAWIIISLFGILKSIFPYIFRRKFKGL